jgi:dihydrofolate reductase
MLQIVYYVAASADGFIAAEDGSVDWLSQFEGSEDYGYADFYSGIDAVLIGRTTFEQVLTFGDWPYSEKPTWVFSRRELATLPEGVQRTADAPALFSEKLEASGHQRAWLVGGGALAGSFAGAGLITDIIVSVMPVLLGRGVGLFGETGVDARLELESSARFGHVIQNTYQLPNAGSSRTESPSEKGAGA